MATRLYLGVAVLADPQPAYAADWTTTSSGTRIQLNGAPDDSALIVSTRTETSTGAVRALGSQWISGPMAAGSISGTIEVAVRTSTNNVASGVQMYMVAKVVSRDGTVLRGVLYAGLVGLVYSTTLAVQSSGTVAISTVAASAGDRVVVELGHNFNNVVATSYNGSFSLGSPVAAADLTNTNGTTAANRPWVEFSTTLPLLNEAVVAAAWTETMGVVVPDIRMTAMWVEAIGQQLPVEASISTAWMEVIGRQLPVEAALTTLWLEVFGVQKPVEAALTTMWVEVLGVPGEPPPAPTEGVQNVTRSGWLKILHPSGTWKTPKPRGLPTGPTYQVFTNTGSFTAPPGVTSVSVLVVAGGGSGGNSFRGGGGGGAGGVIWTPGVAYTEPVSVVVGAGGVHPITATTLGNNGEASSYGSIVATGGGGGGGAYSGSPGGSGGGGAGAYWDGTSDWGEGIDGQGNHGGHGRGSADPNDRAGGGGGGAGSYGEAAVGGVYAGPGGIGVDMSANVGTAHGVAGWFGGGGGGGATNSPPGTLAAGGQGGGGAGDKPGSPTGHGTNGTAGTGGGGGGGGNDGGGSDTAAGDGGSGIVIVRYLV